MTPEEIDIANRQNWNGVHVIRHDGALSGSPALEVLNHHRISRVWSREKILDIGVGLGGMAEYLHSQDCVVDCLDVADEAEKTVRPFCRRFYLAENIETLPSDEYDLAISMLVAQHMCERNLRRQIREVYRSLKPGAMYSLHLAGAMEDGKNNLAGEIPSGMDGAMCRTPDYALAMIHDEAPKSDVTILGTWSPWIQFRSYWYFVHIVKPTCES